MAYSSYAVTNTTATSRPTSSSTSKPSSFGICTSRKSRSGCSSDTTLTASKPFAHSATMSTSWIGVRYSRSTARASASSSTMATRSLGVDASVIGETGDGELDAEAFRVGPRRQPRLCAEHGRQPLPHVVEPDAPPRTGRRVRIARVLDRNRQTILLARDVQPNHTTIDQVRDAVRDGVLDERLQHQRR